MTFYAGAEGTTPTAHDTEEEAEMAAKAIGSKGQVWEIEQVTVGEASPEECKALCLAAIEQATHADSLDHIIMHLRSAELWARGADWSTPTPHTKEENIEFRKAWDARVDAGRATEEQG